MSTLVVVKLISLKEMFCVLQEREKEDFLNLLTKLQVCRSLV